MLKALFKEFNSSCSSANISNAVGRNYEWANPGRQKEPEEENDFSLSLAVYLAFEQHCRSSPPRIVYEVH
jgi:hypothetical protein